MQDPKKVKRKQGVIAFGGVFLFVFLLVFGMWLSDPNKDKPSIQEQIKNRQHEVNKNFTAGSGNSVSAEETWISKSETDLEALKKKNKQQNEKIKEQDEKINRLYLLIEGLREQDGKQGINSGGLGKTESLNRSESLPPPPLPGMGTEQKKNINPASQSGFLSKKIAEEVVGTVLPPSPTGRGSSNSGNQELIKEPEIEVISLTDDNPIGSSKKHKNVKSYLPAGSFASAVLLSGVDAPTGGQAKSNPVPVLLRIYDEGQLPNYWHSNVDNCHVTGAAHGDMSSERAHIRLEKLTCILLNGDVVEEPIKGYVAGEDGKAGMRGKLVSKQGSLIAKSLFAGIASGMGSSISKQYQNVSSSALGQVSTIDPDKALSAGLASGTNNALEKIADFYIARANELYPIIEVDANRIGEIILLGGTDLKNEILGNTRESYDEG